MFPRRLVLFLALGLAVPTYASVGSFGCVTALSGKRPVGPAEKLFEAAALAVLQRHHVAGYQLVTTPFLDINTAEPDDRGLRQRLTAAFGDQNAWWNLHGLTAAPESLAPVPGNVAFAEMVQALLAEADRVVTERPANVRTETLGHFGGAENVVIFDDAATGDPLFVEETHAIGLLPAETPERFRVTILALPGDLLFPVVLANFKLGETDAVVVVRDRSDAIVGVAPFVAGYQNFVERAANRSIEERAFARSGGDLRAELAGTRARTASQAAALVDAERRVRIAELHRQWPTVDPEALAGNRPMRSDDQMLPLLPVVFGPAFLLLPFSLPILAGQEPMLPKEIGQVLAYGYAWHVVLLLSSNKYLGFSYNVARRLGIFAPWSLWAHFRARDAQANLVRTQDELERLRQQERVLQSWWERHRQRMAEPMGGLVRELGTWEPTQPALRTYWDRENESMMAYEATGLRLFFRRIEALGAPASLAEAMVRLLETYGTDYWGAVVAGNAVLDPIEQQHYGETLRFREAFAVGP